VLFHLPCIFVFGHTRVSADFRSGRKTHLRQSIYGPIFWLFSAHLFRPPFFRVKTHFGARSTGSLVSVRPATVAPSLPGSRVRRSFLLSARLSFPKVPASVPIWPERPCSVLFSFGSSPDSVSDRLLVAWLLSHAVLVFQRGLSAVNLVSSASGCCSCLSSGCLQPPLKFIRV
jgi:hypothetical protein